MSLPYVFDITKCEIEAVQPIPQANWFQDTQVPQSPDPIDDCMPTPIIPPPPEIPCPQFPQGVYSAQTDVELDCQRDGYAKIWLTFYPTECCGFDLDIDMEMEVPCPVWPQHDTWQEATTNIVCKGDEQLRFKFIDLCKDPDPEVQQCGFELQMDVDFPCPQFPQGEDSADTEIVAIGEEYLTITFDSHCGEEEEDKCDFDFEIDIGFPCPQFPQYSQCVQLPCNQQICFSMTPTEPCGFEFDVQGEFIMPCPQFPQSVDAQTEIVPIGSEKLTIQFTNPQSCQSGQEECDFDVDVDVDFPCPQFPQYSQCIQLPCNQQLCFSMTPTDPCGFEFDVQGEFIMPCPQFPQSVQAETEIVTIGNESLTIQFTNPQSCQSGQEECDFDVDVDVQFPCPQFPQYSQCIQLPCNQQLCFSITPTDPCGFEFDVQGDFIMPCPQFPQSVQATTQLVSPGEEQLTIQITNPQSCQSGEEECEFDMEVDVSFPIVCPQFPQEVQADTEEVQWGNQSLTMTIEEQNPDDPQDCEFDVQIQVQFPCVQINGGPVTGTCISGSIDVQKETPCEYTISAQIDFDTDCLQQGPQGPQGPEGPQGPTGPQGPEGPAGSDGDKYAIVKVQDGWVGLSCTEQPSPVFADILAVHIPAGEMQATTRLDPRFYEVCEPDTIRVTGLVPNQPILLGAEILNDELTLTRPWLGSYPPVVVNVTVSGIRRGRAGQRFPKFTKEQAERNAAFWSSAYANP